MMMPDDPPYILDVRGLKDEPPEQGTSVPNGRTWIGIHFECCGIYSRIYRNKEGTAYKGYCPRCTRPVRVGIGRAGTHHRIFRAR